MKSCLRAGQEMAVVASSPFEGHVFAAQQRDAFKHFRDLGISACELAAER
jgi:hypothetical protein